MTLFAMKFTDSGQGTEDLKSIAESAMSGTNSDNKTNQNATIPLAELIRPHDISNYIGQDHLMSENGSLKNYLRLGFLPSMILYGPPGVGKTTIASILAKETNYEFLELSATSGTVADLKKILTEIILENERRRAAHTDYLHVVVFIDEIHRFSKIQQDFLLPYIESGLFVFIGATTVRPKSRIRRAILSRCQLFELKALQDSEIERVLHRAILYENIRRKYVYEMDFITFEPPVLQKIVKQCNGDSRKAINMIELVSGSLPILQKASYEPYKVLDKDIARAFPQSRDGNRLRDDRNLNLMLKLFDSMRNTFVPREIELIDDVIDSREIIPRISQEKQEEKEEPQKDDKNPETDERHTKKVPTPKTAGVPLPERTAFSVLLLKFNPEELEARIQNSDDSDFEQGDPYSDVEESFEKPEYLEEGIQNRTVTQTDQYVYLSQHYLNALIERGESVQFVVKQLILFTCLYADNKKIKLTEAVSIIRAIKTSSADPKKVLTNFIERVIRSKKRKVDSEENDPIKLFKKIKQDVRKVLEEGDIEEGSLDLPVTYEQGLIQHLLSEDYESPPEGETHSSEESNQDDDDIFPVEIYDHTKHAEIIDV